jgi:hypothetical protein
MHGRRGFALLLAMLAAAQAWAVDASMAEFERICAEGDRQVAGEWLQALEIDERARDLERLLNTSGVEARIVALLRFGSLLDKDEAARLVREAVAGAAVQPRLLGSLLLACPRIAGAAEICADLPDRIVALEPSNAWGWMSKAARAQRGGDREGTRAALLASGRSSQYLSPDREVLRMVWEDLRAHPSSEALASARHGMVLDARAGDHEGPMICAVADPQHDAASTALGHFMATPIEHVTALREQCGTARAAQDSELLAACLRLLRMIEDQAFSYFDVRLALRLRGEIGTASELAAAFHRETDLMQLYEALADRERSHETLLVTPDAVQRLIEHGEIAYWRWLVDEFEPESRAGDAPDGLPGT